MDKMEKKEKLSGKRMGWICLAGAVLTIILILTGVILGYFVNYIGSDGEPRDGLGRMIDQVPEGFSFIMLQWAGFIWFFIDCIVIFSLIILTDKLIVRSKIYFTGVKNVDF